MVRAPDSDEKEEFREAKGEARITRGGRGESAMKCRRRGDAGTAGTWSSRQGWKRQPAS
ncbi:hypothetical protein BJX96DRAFT_140471 [Aspergillus floccosus]